MKETNEGDLLEERCDSPRRVYASETRVVTDISYKATNFFLVAQSNLNRVYVLHVLLFPTVDTLALYEI